MHAYLLNPVQKWKETNMKETESFDFLIQARTESRARVLGIPVKSFLEGQKYRYSFSVTNISEKPFPGGKLKITVIWPTQQQNEFSFELPEILPKTTFQTEEKESGVMSRGYGLFFVLITSSQPQEFRLCTGDPKNPIAITPYIPIANRGTSFHILFGKANEEIYEFWGMILAAMGLFIIALKEIVQFFLLLFSVI